MLILGVNFIGEVPFDKGFEEYRMQKFNKLEEEGIENGQQNCSATTEKHGVMEELGKV